MRPINSGIQGLASEPGDPNSSGNAAILGQQLDQRRCEQLRFIDEEWPAYQEAGDAARNWMRIRGANDHNYFSKVLAIFSRIQNCGVSVSRKVEGNNLLRYLLFNSPAPLNPHRAVARAIRAYVMYNEWLDADVRGNIRQRLSHLNDNTSTNQTENHQYIYTSQKILSREIFGLQNTAGYAELKNKMILLIRDIFTQGLWEFGSNYQEFTRGALIDLVDLAQDQEIREYALLALDYLLVEQAAFSIGHYFSGAKVRIYEWGVNSDVESVYTRYADALYGTPHPQRSRTTVGAMPIEIVATNYSPLVANYLQFQQASPFETSAKQGSIYNVGNRGQFETHHHYFYKGNSYGIGVNQRVEQEYGSHHGYVNVHIQSSSHRLARVFPWSLSEIGGQVSGSAERSFGYKNVAFSVNGGSIRRGNESQMDRVPARLFYSKDFTSREINGCRAFLSDGTTYVAWMLSEGNVQQWQSTEYGGFLESSFRSDRGYGEISTFEVGDASTYGSFQNFKNSILSRNNGQCPRLNGNWVSWRNKGGVLLEFGRQGTFQAKVNGVLQNPAAQTDRISSQFLNNHILAAGSWRVEFDYANRRLLGDTQRFAPQKHWGLQP